MMAMQDGPSGTRTSGDRLVRLFSYSLLLVLLFNAFHIFQFPLTIDGEVAAFTPSPDNYIENERWAAYLLILVLMPHAVIPVVPDLLASLALAASYTLTSCDWDPEIGFRHYVAAPLALMFPLFAEVMLFPDLSYALFLGLLIAAAAAVMLRAGTFAGYAGGFACLAFAAGIYQPIVLYPVAAHVVRISLTLDRDRGAAGVADWIAAPIVIVLALVSSHLVGHGLSVLSATSSSYLDASTNIGLLLDDPADVLRQTASTATEILSGSYQPLYLDSCRIVPVILALSVVVLAATGRWRSRPGRTGCMILLLVLGLLAMVGVVAIDGGSLPNRTLLGLPIAAAGLVFAGSGSGDRRVRLAFAGCSALCILGFATIGSRVYYASYVTWLNDRALGQQIVERIETLPDLPLQRPLPLEIVGHHEWPASPMTPAVEGSMVGSSFFSWDQGSVQRILRFFRSIGVSESEFVAASKDAHLSVMEAASAMPSWPLAGSVRSVGGTVVVKFSAYSESQL